MKILLITAFSVLLSMQSTPTKAQPAVWDIDYARSDLGFSGVQSGQVFTGGFKNYTVNVRFDLAQPETGSIEAIIDMASAQTGDRERDTALPSSEWFGIKEFPSALFKSKTITAAKKNQEHALCFEAAGDLRIRNLTKTISLPFCLYQEGMATRVRGKITLMRNDFGIGQGEWNTEQMVKFSVDVAFNLLAQKKG